MQKNVHEILERAKLLKRALNEHSSIARAERTADALPSNEIRSVFFKRPRPYKSRNAREKGEREFHAKSVRAEEGGDESGISSAGTPVTSVNDGCDVREGADVGGAPLYASVYTDEQQQVRLA